jgi:choline dehydrogenase-like flavoprotein
MGEAALPAGRFIPPVDGHDIDRLDAFLAQNPGMVTGYKSLIHGLDLLARVRHPGRSFVRLSSAERLSLLEWLRHGGYARRMAVRALIAPLKVAHYTNPGIYRSLGCVWEYDKPARDERPRWVTERTLSGRDFTQDEELECDVVVIGTGAGGAVMARELAELGCAVVMVEEGDYFTRSDFSTRAFDVQSKMYRGVLDSVTVGNCGIVVPVGRTVGGSTTVNSGTCYRVPDRVLHEWTTRFGLSDLTPDALAPHYERVEAVLGVAPVRPEVWGGVGRVIARGCEKLGYKHAPLKRNAPECDGKGVCTCGCPTDAKRSTNVSYVPMALKAGAQLLCAVRVDEVTSSGGKATGIKATARGSGKRVTVRARTVVVACGTLYTPRLLARSGLAGRSGQLGKNLSIHPATAGVGVFAEDIDGLNAVPQGYAIEEFHDEGILFEGGSPPLDMAALGFSYFGPRYTQIMEEHRRSAYFGFMIEDTSRGRMLGLRSQHPLLAYVMNDHDVARLKRGVEILVRVFFAAGAKEVLLPVHGFEDIRNEADVARLSRATLKARDFDLSAYHPLGTARMGLDPASSVVGPTHETHETRQLFVVDGSAVPSSLGVNPQMTIMALATRAAPFVARAAERAH